MQNRPTRYCIQMVFSSIPFLFYYLPLLLLAYYLIPQSQRQARNLLLTAASLIFYAWGEGVYVLLLIFSICLNHLIAKRLITQNKTVLFAGIAINLLLLGWYKYAGFMAEAIGITDWPAPHLPLGISFFTFQAISYLIDVYRKEAKGSESIFNTALYISSFPQLIAGPIVRYKYVAQQILQRRESVSQFALGIQFFVIGLAQKMLLANTVGEVADNAFESTVSLNTVSAWVGLLAYSLQIYFDFAGYSNMAIGLGHMLGFQFPRNFNTPYSATSVTYFWRRWHMTLSEWFRDYLYIPLGGSRNGAWQTIANLWIVFLLCGFWHGAAWTFILWGAWHGLFLSIERLGLAKLLNRLWSPFQHLYLLLAVFLGWVLFRANSFNHAIDYYASLFGLSATSSTVISVIESDRYLFLLAFALLLSTSLPRLLLKKVGIQDSHNDDINLSGRTVINTNQSNLVTVLYWGVLFCLFMLSCLAVIGSAYNPFIYFRF